jgi:hypothetical protein
MKTASIVIEVGTIYNGKTVRNTVVLQIPRGAAVIISKAWQTEKLPQRNAIVAHGLLSNQVAHCDLVIDNGIAGGMTNMAKVNCDNKRFFKIEDDEED